jgi:DNA-binding NarL/FixJ family response regulator
VIADDHPLWRETLGNLLAHGEVATVVGEAGTGDEAVAVAARVEADVVVLDIDMPQLNGIEATRQITQANPNAKVLILSSLKQRDDVLAALHAGARGYLLKTAGRSDVVDAIRRIHAGELVFPPELASIVLAELQPSRAGAGARPLTGLDALTDRERDVLRLIAEGASNQAAAARLHLSPKTIETHIGAIFSKLGLEPDPDHHRRVQAALTFLAAAHRQG